ncbi:MAG: ABC transporter ATP-binding protein [Desulfomicrobium sp.]|jgi:heme exporter protein A|nr:ABC transporter ATP-binding protein [Desulfomicrobium sp.]
MSEAEPLLRLSQVGHFFGSRLIFKGVSCTLDQGQIMLVAGPNGAGKSTLLKVMAGLLEPTAGVVTRQVVHKNMAFMGHQTFVYAAMTALANLEFWNALYGRGLKEKAIIDLLDRVGLKGFALELAGTFSRGMAQRLSLARVLLIEPELIFLDEPATGLDRASQAILHGELTMARQRGAGIVWISHDLERDLGQADMLLYLNRGQMSYYGPGADFDLEEQA